MAEDPGSPLLRLAAPRLLTRRRRTFKLPGPPSRDPPKHAAKLGAGLNEVRKHVEEGIANLQTFATEVPYVRLEFAASTVVLDADLASLGLVPVYRREDSVLAAYAKDGNLRTFDKQLISYAQLQKKLAVLAKIESVKPWSREDRMGPQLKELTIDSSREYTVDLLVMPIEGEEQNPAAIRAIEQFVESQRGRIVDRALEPTFSALRVRLGGQALDQMLEYRDDIAIVELPPAAAVVIPQALSVVLDDIPELSAPDSTAPAICVVDSGILEGHPLLEPAIVVGRSRSFPAHLGPPIPQPPVAEAAHGTNVAGVALYGDVASAATAKQFTPELRIINARILDDKNELHPDRMPFLRNIVEHVKDDCRLLNLSFGLDPCSGFLSVHAAELDAISKEFAVLFVVSSGNVGLHGRYRGLKPGKPYPEYLLEDSGWRVRAPAEALNVLTVGGLTTDGDLFRSNASVKLFGAKRAPSPFSCHGGLKNVLKPDVVDVAGNVAWDSQTRRWLDNDAGLRIATTSHEFANGRLVGFVNGTSISAPKVSHLGARLLARYPEASPNLLRALIVQSARMPEGVADWPKERAMKLCGFGVPDLDRALYCRPQRVTLYYEGTIMPDDVQIFDVVVPTDFAKAKGLKTISVSIAYDPPVSVVHRDRPAGVHLTWGLARGDVSEATLHTAIAAEAQAEADDHAVNDANVTATKKKSPFMSSALPKRPQQRGTVQKSVFTWKRGAYGETYRLAVTAKAVRQNHATTGQTFAVVVSLECADTEVNVFSLVRARLGAGRVRLRVPAS